MNLFLKNLLSDCNDISHKRLIAISSFVVLVVMVVLKATNIPIDTSLIYTFASLSSAYSTMTLIDKKIINEQVVSGDNNPVVAV